MSFGSNTLSERKVRENARSPAGMLGSLVASVTI